MSKYDAFISYSHANDKAVASSLQSIIQSIGKPWYKRRSLRIFRDATSLAADPSLWSAIESALNNSRYLILLGSARGSKSPWVDKEVTHWIETKGVETILIGVTEGELSWSVVTNDFLWSEATPLPKALKGKFGHEPRWIDLREFPTWADQKAKVAEVGAEFAAKLHGVSKEDLVSAEVAQHRRAIQLVSAAVVVLILLVAVATIAYHSAVGAKHGEALQRESLWKQQALELADHSLRVTEFGDAGGGLGFGLEALNLYADNAQRAPPDVLRSVYTAYVRNRETAWFSSEHPGAWATASARPLAAIADDLGGIRVGNTRTGRTVTEFHTSTSRRATSIKFDPLDFALLAVAGGEVNVWNIAEQKPPSIMRAQALEATFCGGANKIAVISGLASGVSIWTEDKATHLNALRDNSEFLKLKCSSDGSKLIAYGFNTGVYLIDTARDKIIFKADENYSVNDPELFSGKNLMLLSSNEDLAVIDTSNGKVIARIRLESSGGFVDDTISAWAIGKDGQYVATGSTRGRVQIWDAANGRAIKMIAVGDAKIRAVALDGKSRRLLTASDDGYLRLFDVKSGAPLAMRAVNDAPFVAAMFDPNFADDDEVEKRIVSADADGTVTFWEISGGSALSPQLPLKSSLPGLSSLQLQSGAVVAKFGANRFVSWNTTPAFPILERNVVAQSADGNVLALEDRSKDHRGSITVTNVKTGKVIAYLFAKGHTDRYPLIGALSPDGAILVSGGADRTLKFWNAVSGELVHSTQPLPNNVTTIAISPNGKSVAIGFGDGNAELWDAAPPQKRGSFESGRARIASLAFDHEGQRIAVAFQNRFMIYNSFSGEKIVGAMNTNTKHFVDIKFNANSSQLVTLDAGGVIASWDAKSLERLRQVKTDSILSTHITYDPSQSWIVSRGNLLDAAELQPLIAASPRNTWYVSPYFTSEGANLDENFRGEITKRFLPRTESDLLARARSATPRCLTTSQRASFAFLTPTPPAWCTELDKSPDKRGGLQGWFSAPD